MSVRFLALILIGCASRLCSPAAEAKPAASEWREGGIIRGPTNSARIALVFTGHEYAEGGTVILDELARHHGKGSFFFTGHFLAQSNHQAFLQRLVRERHYLGPHSDQHVLYLPWDGSQKLLVTREQFAADLQANLEKIYRLGVPKSNVRYFLPPYEHYNRQIADWSRELGLVLVNYTPGTRSNADYTGEADRNFVPSDVIYRSIIEREKNGAGGLNGFLLLLHVGSGPGRNDKFHARFPELLNYLAEHHYRFVRVDELLEGENKL